MDELKRELAGSLYEAQSVMLELGEIIKNNNYSILDEIDYQKEYIKLLRNLKIVTQRQQEKDTPGSLLLVARHLQDSEYLSAWFEKLNKES